MGLIKLEINNVGKLEDAITQNQINKLRRQFQSSNINIILGAAFSYGVVELLGNIETDLYTAEYIDKDESKVIEIKKRFFNQSIIPLIDKEKIKVGESERIKFITLLNKIIDNRQSSILHKIINIFTTNYDHLLEIALEKSSSEYVDGFSGKLRPMFSTSNYGMIYSRQTSISSMTSEIVTFNLYKLHGSLNWYLDDNNIFACDIVSRIKKLNSTIGNDNDFINEYNKLAIVNPSKSKLNKTVIDVNYYDQLRMLSNEMEKNNSILISFGFSFNDEHIRQITYRFLKGNPTLNLIILSFDEESTITFNAHFGLYSNVSIIQLVSTVKNEDGSIIENFENFTLERLNIILEEIYNGTK